MCKRDASNNLLFEFDLAEHLPALEIAIHYGKNDLIDVKNVYVIAGKYCDDKLEPKNKARQENDVLRFLDFYSPALYKQAQTRKKGVLISGRCFVEQWTNIKSPFGFVEYVLQNKLSTLPPLQRDVSEYEAHIISLPLRHVILPEISYYHGLSREELDKAIQRLDLCLENTLEHNIKHNLTAFVCNFIIPQKKILGRLVCSDEIIDIKVALEELNKHIAHRLHSSYKQAFVLDVDAIASSYGKRFIAEDIWSHTNHGSTLSNYGYHPWDQDRIEKFQDFSIPYEKHRIEFLGAVWNEVSESVSILNMEKQLKIVIVDLDGTMWRGELAEEGQIDHSKLIEGWPLGFAEALLVLKQRGILLAIASNNEFATIEKLWDQVFSGCIKLSDFVSVKINWDDKAKKIAEILHEVNLLPNSALFIDDNPRERERVRGAFPDIYTLEEPYFNWKRFLLWSSATQVPSITTESKSKTEMLKDKIARDQIMPSMNRQDYLKSLSITLTPDKLSKTHDTARAFELLNKTNQFNTSGGKIDQHDFNQYLEKGCIYQFSCSDNLSNYGIISVLIIEEGKIVNFVMSCRVFGLDIEKAILSWIQQQHSKYAIHIQFKKTDRNTPTEGFLLTIGRENAPGRFGVADAVSFPEHIQLLAGS